MQIAVVNLSKNLAELDVALMVDQSVPAAQVASLQKSVASLVGLSTARGDTMAVTRLAFAKTSTPTAKTGPLASIDPISLSRPRHRAPPIVAIASACRTSSASGPPSPRATSTA